MVSLLFRKIPENLQKKACKYLLQRFLGQFLKEKLSVDQLTFSLCLDKGEGSVRNLLLDVEVLNEHGESYNLPVEFVDGFINLISVRIPWRNLSNENCVVSVHGLRLSVRPKQRLENVSMFDSMWGSMTTSLQLAQECLQQHPPDGEKEIEGAQPFEGLEIFARAIDTVLTRIKFQFTDTVIRVEHVPKFSSVGVALEMRIKKMEYCDEAADNDCSSSENIKNINVYEPASFSTKKFCLEGTSLYTQEFSLSDLPKKFETLSTSPSSPEMPPQHPRLLQPESVEQDLLSGAVLVSKIMGKQEIRLRLKQNEAITGPKVDVEFNFGPVTFLLCPKQVHMLVQLFEGLSSPDKEGQSGQPYHSSSGRNKPMQAADYAVVEQELQRQLSRPNVPSRSLLQQRGWSSHSLGEESDEEFLPVSHGQGIKTRHSEPFPMHSDMDNSFSSTISNNTASSSQSVDSGSVRTSSVNSRQRSYKHRGSVQGIMEDTPSELTQFRIRCSILTLMLLHEDVLPMSASSEGGAVSISTQDINSHMQIRAEKFFDALSTLILSGQSSKKLSFINEGISDLCPYNHLRFSASPFTLEGDEKACTSQWLLSFLITIAELEAVECLFVKKNDGDNSSTLVPEYSKLLSFDEESLRIDGNSIPSWTEPIFQMKYERTERTAQPYSIVQPCSRMTFQLGPFWSEVDMSIIERTSSLFKPYLQKHDEKQKDLYRSNVWDIEDQSLSISERFELHISSPFAVVSLCFPVPDLRPVHDKERVPWWQRNLRKEKLIFELTSATVNTVAKSDEKDLCIELQWKDGHVFLQETPNSPPVAFLRTSVEATGNNNSKEYGFDWPRLEIKIHPVIYPSVLETEHSGGKEDSMPFSMDFIMSDIEPTQSSPFAVRKVVYETDSNFGDIDDEKPQETTTETDEVIMPADKMHLKDFIDKTLSNTHLSFEFSLPTLNIVIPNKHFYEVLYNRLGSDIPLWEPIIYFMDHQEPTDVILGPALDIASQLRNTNFQEFSMCKSALQCDSSSDSDDGSTLYYSAYDPRLRKKRRDHLLSKTQSYMVININVNKAKFTLYPPLRDNLGNVIPEQCGEIQAHAEDGSFFAVSNYQGDPKVNYMCVQANKATVYHKSVSTFIETKRIDPVLLEAPSHLHPTLYRSESGVPQNGMPVGVGGDSADMFSAVIKIGLDDEQDLKTFKVAVGARGGTLRHQMTTTAHSWITQFIDLFDVYDYPISGYSPPAVVTELHLQLWNCGVDYRPLYLPLRSFITLENFSISSNIAAKTSSTVLRIISEELCLLISNKTETKCVDLKKDYVCVVETGLIDLSLRMSDSKDCISPKVDLKASNNIVNIRTCSDSCQALQDLLLYFVNDGDLVLGTPEVSRRGSQDPLLLTNGPEEEPNSNHVHSLMEDAMREDFVSASENSDSDDEPDFRLSSAKKKCTGKEEPNQEIFPGTTTVPLEAIADQYTDDEEEAECLSADEEFCILGEDPGTGINLMNGEPNVRMLTTEPIRVIDNHFALPLGKSDQLKAPRHYPNPVLRYTLREMSIVWQIYGGNDFDVPKTEGTKASKATKNVRIDESEAPRKKPVSSPSHARTSNTTPDKFGLSYNKNYDELQWTSIHSGDVPSMESERVGNLTWQAKGGRGRKHDVLMEFHMNKVRVQHEVYPEHTEQAARQVVLIHNFEVRDRLASSEINKFLYHYTSEALPRQSRANMLEIKALHIRPSQTLPTQECSLRVSLQPLRLNVDQDSLLFLCNFFSEVCSSNETAKITDGSGTTFHQTPVMGFTSSENCTSTEPATDQQLLIMLQESGVEGKDTLLSEQDSDELSQTGSSGAVSNSPIFFRSFVFSPEVPIRLDYHSKRLDMEQGALAGLIMRFLSLNCSEIRLKRLCYRHGLLGVDRLLTYAMSQWINDIKRNQLQGILGGVGPMHTFVQVFQGFRDLFWLPVVQVRKDGRIFRGIKKGATSWSTSTACGFLELANLVVQTIQSVAEFTYDMVSPGPSVRSRALARPRWQRNTQPADVREGMANAYHVVKEGLDDTVRRLVRVAAQEHELKGVSGAVGGILRQIPPTVVKPLILTTEATSNVLGGIKNQLVPDAHREAVEKWRSTRRY